MIHDIWPSHSSLRRNLKPNRCSSRSRKQTPAVIEPNVVLEKSFPIDGSIECDATDYPPLATKEIEANRLESPRTFETNFRVSDADVQCDSGVPITRTPESLIQSPNNLDSPQYESPNYPLSVRIMNGMSSSIQVLPSSANTISSSILNHAPSSISSSLPDSGNSKRSRIQRMSKQLKTNVCIRRMLMFFAIVCALHILFFLLAYERVVDSIASDQLALYQSGQKYEAWSKTNVPVFYKVHVFNLTNHNDFMKGATPVVHEIGPYTYRMVEEKTDVTFHDNGTVSYRTKPMYFFEPHMSNGTESDKIYTVNIPFINAADAVKHNPFLKFIINAASDIHNFETIRHLEIRELLWGHNSKVLDWGRNFQDLPYPHPDFGLLVGMNNTAQEKYSMYTGVGDPDKLNKIYSWNGKTKLDFWDGDQCNKIDGTDAGGFRYFLVFFFSFD